MNKLLESVATQNHDWIKDLILTILDIVQKKLRSLFESRSGGKIEVS